MENSRLDISFSVAFFCLTAMKIFEQYSPRYIKKINSVLSHFHKYSYLDLLYPELNEDSFNLKENSNASFATNYDKSSQLVYSIYISNEHDKYHPIHWAFYKHKCST